MKFLAGNEFSEIPGDRAMPAAGYAYALELRKGKDDSLRDSYASRTADSTQNIELDMSTASDNTASIDEILEHIERLLVQTWQETGFGSLTIESDRNNHKIRVIIKGGTHFRYVISDRDVVRRAAIKSLQGN